MAAFLENLLRPIPPLLESCLVEDRRYENSGQLVHCELARITGEHRTHKLLRLLIRLLSDALEINRDSGEDVLPIDPLQGVGRVLQLHRMSLLGREIDGDLIDEKIDVCDLSKTPVLVKHAGPRGEVFKNSGH